YSVWDDKDIDSCWYINVSGGIEIIPSCSNITFEAVEGLNNITIYVNDSSNNINYTQIFFYVDITSPVVNLENPQNNSLITNTNNITFYYNVSDNIGIENASLIINDILNQTNYSIIINTTQNFIVLNMPNGQYNWSVIAYDLAGNWNISYVYNLTIRFFWCGDGICNNGETCNSCRADCGVCTPAGGGGGGGGGGSSGGGALIIPKEGTGEENIKPEKEEVIEARKRNIGYSTKSAVAESPAVFEKEKNIIPNLDFVIGGIIFGLTIILISSLLWHFPLIYFYRRTFADEEVIIKFIEKDRLRYHRKIFVTPNVYERYKLKLEEQKKKCNLAPIYLYKKDEKFVNHLIYRYHINTELAKLICAAKRGVISRILTTEKISDELRKRFRKIKFEDPFEYEKKFGS
ncbi:MAG: Ig-like domain-containing protein, partial [Candidatus Woesearchaeota archaeon]